MNRSRLTGQEIGEGVRAGNAGAAAEVIANLLKRRMFPGTW